MKQKLAIFDLDGTLYNTSRLNYMAYQEAMKEYGFEGCNYDYFCNNCNGKHYTEFLPNITTSSQEILSLMHKSKKSNYKKYISEAKENKHLFNIINGLKDEYYIAIVTTASKENTLDLLDNFNKTNLFDLILTAEDVSKQKPSPEGYNQAIKHFNLINENVLIFEDSKIGLIAAVKSGANVLKVEKFI